MTPSSGRRPIFLIIAAVILTLIGLNSYYTVQPEETAVILGPENIPGSPRLGFISRFRSASTR